MGLTDVAQVHDLHVWNLSIGKPAMSVHLLVQSSTLDADGEIISACSDAVLRKAQQVMNVRFGIDHCTIQIEKPHNLRCESRGSCPSYCEKASSVREKALSRSPSKCSKGRSTGSNSNGSNGAKEKECEHKHEHGHHHGHGHGHEEHDHDH